jgi:hypothetical protein
MNGIFRQHSALAQYRWDQRAQAGWCGMLVGRRAAPALANTTTSTIKARSIAMMRTTLCCVGCVAGLAFGASEAGAVGLNVPPGNTGSIVQLAHSVDEAEERLQRRGYYDIRLERASLPYSFSACKRGVRYHIHINYYGDLVQVDSVGSCDGYGYDRRRYYDGYDGRYRYRPRYDD